MVGDFVARTISHFPTFFSRKTATSFKVSCHLGIVNLRVASNISSSTSLFHHRVALIISISKSYRSLRRERVLISTHSSLSTATPIVELNPSWPRRPIPPRLLHRLLNQPSRQTLQTKRPMKRLGTRRRWITRLQTVRRITTRRAVSIPCHSIDRVIQSLISFG